LALGEEQAFGGRGKSMAGLKGWKTRIRTLREEGKREELYALACELFRLSAPMFREPSKVEGLICLAERYKRSEFVDAGGLKPDEAKKRYMANNAMTASEYHDIRENGPTIAILATQSHMVSAFAEFALHQLSILINGHLEKKLGNSEPLEQAIESLDKFYSLKGVTLSRLDWQFPEAAKRLEALLRDETSAKTLDRLTVFRSFTIHGSFRHIALEQASQIGETTKNPDHTGPAYKVRKLGEALGLQLTCLSTKTGRSSTELTTDGLALADWTTRRPHLFS
jgi:hypothetical protein